MSQPNNIAATAENWGAVYIKPGTPYADEPTETIPAGWYVMGIESDEGPNAVIHVQYAFDQGDNDTAKVIANAIADALTDAARATQSEH